jgi:osmotically inducible lipoprotein OsmB
MTAMPTMQAIVFIASALSHKYGMQCGAASIPGTHACRALSNFCYTNNSFSRWGTSISGGNMIARTLFSIAGAAVLAASLTGCGTTKETLGTAGGAVLGGAAGSAVTGGSTLGTVGGAAVGGVIGNQATKP